ncbi:hypothetical protein BST61_g6178 [Cercospora zeina]
MLSPRIPGLESADSISILNGGCLQFASRVRVMEPASVKTVVTRDAEIRRTAPQLGEGPPRLANMPRRDTMLPMLLETLTHVSRRDGDCGDAPAHGPANRVVRVHDRMDGRGASTVATLMQLPCWNPNRRAID